MSTTLSKFESKFRDAALPHFFKGIQSMETFITLALRMGTAILSDNECVEISKLISVAYRETEEAESEVLDIVKSLNQDFEESTLVISQMRAEKQHLEETVKSTKKQLENAEHQWELEQQYLQSAETSLRESEVMLRREKQKKEDAEYARNASVGYMFIPIVGLIVGSTMISVSQTELNNANTRMRSATSNCASRRSILEESERQLQSCRQKVADKKKEMADVKLHLAEKQHELDIKRDLYTKLADVLTVIKRCAQYLCTIHGKVTVLRDQSQHLYCMEPLIVIIEDIVSSVEKLPTAMQLLDSSKAVAKSITNLKENCSRIKAICSE